MELKGLLISSDIDISVSFALFEDEFALIGEIIAVLSLLIVSIVSFLTLRRSSRIEHMIPSLDDMVKVNEDGSVDMDNRLAAIITGVGQTMMQSFKMSALQGLSVDAKLEKGLQGAIAMDVIEEKFPLLEAAGDFLGFNTKKYITKNPKALFQLVGMAQKAGLDLGSFMGNNGHMTMRAEQPKLGRM